jgi:hypothetical protein
VFCSINLFDLAATLFSGYYLSMLVAISIYWSSSFSDLYMQFILWSEIRSFSFL